VSPLGVEQSADSVCAKSDTKLALHYLIWLHVPDGNVSRHTRAVVTKGSPLGNTVIFVAGPAKCAVCPVRRIGVSKIDTEMNTGRQRRAA